MIKRAIPLKKYEAIRRAERMMPLVRRDVLSALEVEAAMRSANDIVMSENAWDEFEGAACYNTISQTMGVYLCIVLAKIYDLPKPQKGQSFNKKANGSEVVSLPLLIRLVAQKRCRKHFIARSGNWNPRGRGHPKTLPAECERQIDRAILLLKQTQKRERRALAKVMEFRNWALAHTLMKDRPHQAPLYNEMFRLIDDAREMYACLALAIASDLTDYEAKKTERYEMSAAFWRPALMAHARKGVSGE